MRHASAVVALMAITAVAAFAQTNVGGVALEGEWRLEERGATVRFSETDGGWQGVIETSARPEEVGRTLFHSLRVTRATQLRGTLVMPENGSAHAAVVTVAGDDLKAVVGVWVFSKTLSLTRVK